MHFMMLQMMRLRLLKMQVDEILSDLDPRSMDYFIPLGCHVSGSIPLIAHFQFTLHRILLHYTYVSIWELDVGDDISL